MYQSKSRRDFYLNWGIVAAAFILAFIGILIFGNIKNRREHNPNQLLTRPSNSSNRAALKDNESSYPIPSQNLENQNIIFINEMNEFKEAARLYLPGELYELKVWDKESVFAYFGKDLTPTYIPEGLQKSFLNGTAEVYICKADRSVYYDSTDLMFYSEFLSNGYPHYPITSKDKTIRGFTLTVSKLRVVNYLYSIDESTFKLSKIGGIDVRIGHKKQGYGLFDPVTDKNEKSYDLFYARFKKTEIEYELVAHNLDLAEVVKIIESIK